MVAAVIPSVTANGSDQPKPAIHHESCGPLLAERGACSSPTHEPRRASHPRRTIHAAYLGLALCTANQLLMRAPMITTMEAALSAMARTLRMSQSSPGVAGCRGT